MGRAGFEVVLFAAACVLHEHGGEGVGPLKVRKSSFSFFLLLNPDINLHIQSLVCIVPLLERVRILLHPSSRAVAKNTARQKIRRTLLSVSESAEMLLFAAPGGNLSW